MATPLATISEEGDGSNMNNASSTSSTSSTTSTVPLTADEVKTLLTEAQRMLDNGEDLDRVISFLDEKGVDADNIINIILREALKLTAGGNIRAAVTLLLQHGLRSEATTIVYATAINMRATGKDPKTIQAFISDYRLTMRQIEERYNILREEIRRMIMRNISPSAVYIYAQKNGIPTTIVIEIVKRIVDVAPSMNRATNLKSLYNIPDYVPQVRSQQQMVPGTAAAAPLNYGELAPPPPVPKPSNVGIRALVAAQAGTNIGPAAAAGIRSTVEAQRAEEAEAVRRREEAERRARIAKQVANRQTALAKLTVGAAAAQIQAETARKKAQDDAKAEIDIRRAAETYYNIISNLLTQLESKTGVDQVNSISSQNQTVQGYQPPPLNKTLTEEKLKLRDRDKRQGWLGPKEPRASYAKYVKDTLLRKQDRLKNFAPLLADRDPYVERVRVLAQKTKAPATEVFNAFNNWRNVISPSGERPEGVHPDLWRDIKSISKPGWFGVSKDYVANMLGLLNNYTNDKTVYAPKQFVLMIEKQAPRPSWQEAQRVRYGIKPAVSKVTGVPFSGNFAPAQSVFPPASYGSVTVGGVSQPLIFNPGSQQGGRRTRKIDAPRRMARTTHRQHGGATPMPLAYYQPGAYETRLLEATGAGIAGASGSWIREPVAQTGGRRTRRHARHSHRHRRPQSGGFTPSVMGQFASAGLRLLPVAGYMGYKMWNKSHKAHKKSGRRTRRR